MLNHSRKLTEQQLEERTKLLENSNLDIHLYYKEYGDAYLLMVMVYLCKKNPVSDEKGQIPFRFIIFKVLNKKQSRPAVQICNILGELINSDYGLSQSAQNINVSYYVPAIADVLKRRVDAGCLSKEDFDKRSYRLKLAIRNDENKVKQLQASRDMMEKSTKQHRYCFQNNSIPESKKVKRLKDELYHRQFVVPIKCADCCPMNADTVWLPAFLFDFSKVKAPVLLDINELEKEVHKDGITIVSDASLADGHIAATCAIFVGGPQGILCSVAHNTQDRNSKPAEQQAMANAFAIANSIFNIDKIKLTFLSDNEDLIKEIKKIQYGKITEENKSVYDLMAGFNISKFTSLQATETVSKIFHLTDRESKAFQKVIINQL